MQTTLLRKLMVVGVGGLFVAAAASTQLSGQADRQGGAPAAPGAPAARGGRGGGGNVPQGGRGPIKVMVVTKGHTYDREPFFQMWDSWGNDITWSHVEHPAADVMLSPKYSKLFDVYAFFDIGGPGVGMGRAGAPAPNIPPGSFKTANNRFYPPPSEQLKTEFPKLLREGKGFVFLHHASAAPGVRRGHIEVFGCGHDISPWGRWHFYRMRRAMSVARERTSASPSTRR